MVKITTGVVVPGTDLHVTEIDDTPDDALEDTVATVPTMDKACYASKHTFTLPDGSPYSVTVKSFRGSAIASPARQEIAQNLWRGAPVRFGIVKESKCQLSR